MGVVGGDLACPPNRDHRLAHVRPMAYPPVDAASVPIPCPRVTASAPLLGGCASVVGHRCYRECRAAAATKQEAVRQFRPASPLTKPERAELSVLGDQLAATVTAR